MTQANNTAKGSSNIDSNGVLLPTGGGTGASTLTANNVLLGNGTSALQVVAPSTSGNVLTSNGTTWTSSTPTAGVTSIVAGTGISISGATGAVTVTNNGNLQNMPANNIGSLACLGCYGTGIDFSIGDSVAGSWLVLVTRVYNNGDSFTQGPPAGTWRFLGGAPGFTGLFVRIA